MTIQQAKNIMLDLRKAYASGNFNSKLNNAVIMCAKMFDKGFFLGEEQDKLWDVFFDGFINIFGRDFYYKTIENMIVDNIN